MKKLITLIFLGTFVSLVLSSCGSKKATCSAYGSVDKENTAYLKK
jgi:uncharacterized protein YhfF